MTFGSAMAPQPAAPQAGAGPQTGAGQQGTDTNPDLVNQWMSYLSHPTVQAGLLQFAASVLQPVGMGESQMGRIGTALGEAGGAVDRVNQQQISEEQRAFENNQQVQRQKLASRQVTADETRAATDQARAATEKLHGEQAINISQQQVDAEKERIKNELALGQGNLGLNERQLDAQARHNLAMEALQGQDIASQNTLRAAQADYYRGFGRQSGGGMSAQDKVASALQTGFMQDWRMEHLEHTPEEEAAAFAQAQTIYPLKGGPAEGETSAAGPGAGPAPGGAAGGPPAWEVISKDKSMLEDLKKQPKAVQDNAVQYYKSQGYDLQKLLGPQMKEVPYSNVESVKPGETVKLTGSPTMTYADIVKKVRNPGLATDTELEQIRKDTQFLSSDDLEKLYTNFPKLRRRLLNLPEPAPSTSFPKK